MPSQYERIPGWFDFSAIYDQAVFEAANGARFVEIGVWKGRSLCYLAEAIRDAGKRIELYGVDPLQLFPGQDAVCRDHLRDAGLLGHLNLLQMTSAEAAAKLDGEFEFVFVDGDHAEAAIRQDIAIWWPKIRKGGVLAGHDYTDGINAPAVQPVVNQFVTENNLRLKCWGSSWWIRKLD